jgi:hypothetical protein
MVERLGEVVVGADLEADDLVDVVVARGQHQDRHVGRRPDLAAHLEPVDVRQHQVEHNEVGLRRVGLLKRLGPVARDLDVVAGVLEVHRHERGDVPLVLHHKDLLGHGHRVPRWLVGAGVVRAQSL